MTAAPVIEARAVAKRYGAVTALAGLDLHVPAGGVFGLLGPNGAGKSTLLRIILGLVRPSAGEIALFGGPATPSALRRVGGFIESPRFHPYLTATQTLRSVALTTGIADADAERLLDRVGLTEAAHRRVDGFSLGMKQRLGIACALIGSPELVILDEPTNGMDPAGIQDIRGLVRTIADRDGATVLLSSHLLDEVQRICDRVAILDRGRLVTSGPIGDLIGSGETLRISATPVEQVLAIAGGNARRDGDSVLVPLARADAPALVAALVGAGVAVEELRWVRGDLESLFFESTSR